MANKPVSRKNPRPRKPLQVEQTSMVQRHLKDDTDINRIVERARRTGFLGNPGATRQPIFGDFSSLDYLEMRNRVADISQQFDALPSRIRKRFQNDPYQLVRFVENPENEEEAIKLELLPQKTKEELLPDGKGEPAGEPAESESDQGSS